VQFTNVMEKPAFQEGMCLASTSKERGLRPETLLELLRAYGLSGKAANTDKKQLMKRKALIMAAMLLGASCDQSHLRQAKSPVAGGESELDREIRRVMEKGINLEERKRQVPAIEKAFARRTDPQRARWLAALCYLKTLGSSFMPLDLAEIALAETGSYGLSGKAVSHKGALGVWQLMPYRAKSHGYSPEEMANDEKCAEAAVRELSSKMGMARGNLPRAKKLYCGIGPAADAYEVKRRQFRREILEEMGKMVPQQAEIPAVAGKLAS